MLIKIKLLVALTIAIGLSGCAPALVKMDSNKRAELQKIPLIRSVTYGPIGPSIQTASDAVTFQATMGIAGYGTPGYKIMKDNGIDDPFFKINQALSAQLKSKAGIKNITHEKSYGDITKHKPEELKAQFGDGVFLQIIPGSWSVIYYVMDWSHYHMYFGARAQLVNTKDNQVLWSAHCGLDRDDGDKAPTHDELLANKATILKRWTEDAVLECSKQLINNYLGNS